MTYAIALDRSRSAFLDEQETRMSGVWSVFAENAIRVLHPKLAISGRSPSIRYLSRDEQRVFDRALRMSVRVIE